MLTGGPMPRNDHCRSRDLRPMLSIVHLKDLEPSALEKFMGLLETPKKTNLQSIMIRARE